MLNFDHQKKKIILLLSFRGPVLIFYLQRCQLSSNALKYNQNSYRGWRWRISHECANYELSILKCMGLYDIRFKLTKLQIGSNKKDLYLKFHNAISIKMATDFMASKLWLKITGLKAVIECKIVVLLFLTFSYRLFTAFLVLYYRIIFKHSHNREISYEVKRTLLINFSLRLNVKFN